MLVIRAPFEERNCVHCHGLHLRLSPPLSSHFLLRSTFMHGSLNTFANLSPFRRDIYFYSIETIDRKYSSNTVKRTMIIRTDRKETAGFS